MQSEKVYTIAKLAALSGVTVRTLRHYEDIGLLLPKARNRSNHRVYDTGALLRLQQILFFRELGFSLEDINLILESENFNLEDALSDHKRLLNEEIKRLQKLVRTIDKTILDISDSKMLTDEEIYEGLSKVEIEEIKAEVKQKYDPKLVAESNRRVKSMSKDELQAMKQAGERILSEIGELMATEKVESSEVQKLIGDYYNHINQNFYTPTPEIYRGLAELYVSDARFTKFFENIKPGLAQFMSNAIKVYCDSIA